MSLPWTNEATFEGLLNHAKIYEKQIKDPTFKSTTKEFQESQIRSYAKSLEKAAENITASFDSNASTNRDKVDKMVNDFNKGDGKKYGYMLDPKDAGEGNVNMKVIKSIKW